MMKVLKRLAGYILVLEAMLMFTGCATQLQSGIAQTDFKGQSYDIQFKGHGGPLSQEINFIVNDQIIDTKEMTTSQSSCVLSGRYKGVFFQAVCSLKPATDFSATTHCEIFVNKKKKEVLEF